MDSSKLCLLVILLAFLLSILIEGMILPRVIYIARKKKLLDFPNSRKRHRNPIPRLAGVTFMPVIIFSTMLSLFARYKLDLWNETLIEGTLPELLLFLSGLILIYLVGAKDDLVGVNYKKKFLVQFLTSLFIVGSGIYINNLYGLFGIYEIPDFIGIILSILLVVFATNSINLIDGADGLASSLGMIALLIYGIMFINYGLYTYATIAFVAIGTLIPFFYYNFFHPSRKIFMGDTGSLTLGYILSFMMLRLVKSPVPVETVPSGLLLLVLAIMYIPLFDAFRVIFVRLIIGRNPFSPDRNHIHHKLIDIGISKRKAVFIIVLYALIIIAINWILLLYLDCNIVLIIDIFLSVFVTWVLYFPFRKIWDKQPMSQNQK